MDEARLESVLAEYGETMSVTDAAKVVGVTRALIYNALEDGRIDRAFGGKRVSTRSLCAYIADRGASDRKARTVRKGWRL